ENELLGQSQPGSAQRLAPPSRCQSTCRGDAASKAFFHCIVGWSAGAMARISRWTVLGPQGREADEQDVAFGWTALWYTRTHASTSTGAYCAIVLWDSGRTGICMVQR